MTQIITNAFQCNPIILKISDSENYQTQIVVVHPITDYPLPIKYYQLPDIKC